MKRHKGFASAYALLLYALILAYAALLCVQVNTYAGLRTIDHSTLYVLSLCRHLINDPAASYPFYDTYDNHEIIVDKEENSLYASYHGQVIEVRIHDNQIISYEYLNQ